MNGDGFNTLRAALWAELDRVLGEHRLPTEDECQVALAKLFNIASRAATPMNPEKHDG